MAIARFPVTVLDCPDHPCCALSLDEGVICCGCGQEVISTPMGLTTRPAPPALVAELHAEFDANRTMQAFLYEARLTARGMLESAETIPPE